MKRIIIFQIFLMAFIAQIFAQSFNEVSEINKDLVLKVDTIVKRDTIIVKEVITRTDIVHRTETIVRTEETKNVNNSAIDEISTSNDVFTNSIITSGHDLSTNELTNDEFVARETFTSDNKQIEREGGNYLWVPDSLSGRVENLLNGNGMTSWEEGRANKPEHFDPFERVTFRGDTINMVLHDRNLGRYSRGLFNFLFIPKGIWQIGLTASYGEFSTEDLEILDLVSDIDFSGHIFSIRPYFSYFIKNNISVGMRLGYTSGKANIGSFRMDIDEDMSLNLHDIMYKSESYSAALTLSQYLGITRRGRFGIYNEVELAFSSGSSDFHRPFGGEMKETHTTTMEAALNFSPGLCVYILDQVSFNVSFGVFGLSMRHDRQTENGVKLGSRTTSGANFRFNLFNINFGIAINI